MNKKGPNALKSKKRRVLIGGVVIMLTLALTLTSLMIPALADTGDGQTAVEAEITQAYGGAASIATMTFDDGLPETSELLNELMKQYGFKATLALVSSYYVNYDADKNPISTKGDVQFFNDLFAEGYLSPISHSRDHKNLAITSSNPITPEQLDEYRYSEVDGSLVDLNYAFPNSDALAYAIPSSWCETVVFENIRNNFYASRGGYCVLTLSPGEMQSLNPKDDLSVGGWYQPYVVRMMPEQYDSFDVNSLIDYLDTCVNNKGWFISAAHAIVGKDTGRGNQDITESDLVKILDAMKVYSDAGKLWVTDYNSAIKYIRERQNSTVSAYTQGDSTYVAITMNDTTGGDFPLPLSADVFNHPLTVKVEVPSTWNSVSYTLGTEDKTASTFTEGNKKYAYVDVVPNGAAVEVTEAALPAGITYGVWLSEADYKAGQMPVYYSTETTLDTLIVATTGVGNLDDIKDEVYKTAGVIPGYVRLYSNLYSKDTVIFVGALQNLTIDLAGYSLTMQAGGGFTIGRDSWRQYPNCSLTVKNGTVNIESGQIIGRPSTKVYFDKVTFNSYKYTQDSMSYDVGALLRYTDCTINLTNERTCWETSASGGRIEFIRTSITQKYSPTRPLFWVKPGAADLTITFDKDCSITRQGNNLLGIASDATEGTDIKLLFELGASFSRDAIPDMTYFSASNYDQAGVNKPANDTIGKVAITSSDFATEYDSYYLVTNGDGTFATTKDVSAYKIIEWAEGGEKIALNVWTEPHIEGTEYSGKYVLMTENGSTIKLYDDITYGVLSTFSDYALTFDLNGHTMTAATNINIELGRGQEGSPADGISWLWAPNRVIRFISSNGRGKLVSTNTQWGAFQARPGTQVYFENLDITIDRYLFNDGGAQLFSLKNCSLHSLYGKWISSCSGVDGGADTVERHIIIDNSVLKNCGLAELYMNVADANFTYTIMNGSVIDNSLPMVKIINDGGAPSAATTRKFNIDVDTKFTNGSVDNLVSIGTTAAQYHAVNVNWFGSIDDFTNPGTALDTAGYAAYAGGKLNIDTLYEDVTYYCFRERPAIGNALQANLTLKTNFNLNFYADPAVIKGIYLGGNLLEATEWDGLDKYTVPFAAHEAANNLTFTVVANLGGEDYTLTLNYSVLAYANQLMAQTQSESEKALIKSVIAYVKEAYAYAALSDSTVVAPAELVAFDSDVEAAENNATPYTHLTSAILGAQLKLDSAVKLVLNLDDSFSGTVRVNGVAYVVENGALADGSESIFFELRAKELYNTPIVIATDSESAEFTLAGYAKRDAVAQSSAKALVDALYTYTYYANAFTGEGN